MAQRVRQESSRAGELLANPPATRIAAMVVACENADLALVRAKNDRERKPSHHRSATRRSELGKPIRRCPNGFQRQFQLIEKLDAEPGRTVLVPVERLCDFQTGLRPEDQSRTHLLRSIERRRPAFTSSQGTAVSGCR